MTGNVSLASRLILYYFRRSVETRMATERYTVVEHSGLVADVKALAASTTVLRVV